MRFLGVRVNVDRAAIEKQKMVEEEKRLLGGVYSETGQEVQIWAARSIAKVFDKLGLPMIEQQRHKHQALQKTPKHTQHSFCLCCSIIGQT